MPFPDNFFNAGFPSADQGFSLPANNYTCSAKLPKAMMVSRNWAISFD